MKKIVLAAAGAALLAGYANAANLVVTGTMGESLATYSKTDNDDDTDDGVSFFDHYMDASQAYNPESNISLSGESAIGGGELELKYNDKAMSMMTLNGWLNFANPFGAPGTMTLRFGRFHALPKVDFVKDANRGSHYQSYAVNPLLQKNVGFDSQSMFWFMAHHGFARSTHSRVSSSYSDYQGPYEYYNTTTKVTYSLANKNITTTSVNWLFNDANNVGGSIAYADTYKAEYPTVMVQYAPNEDLTVRFGATTGAANEQAGSLSHDFYGQKTFTNWNAQVSYNIPEIAKVGLTVKMSDLLSGCYTSGTGLWESAGTDLQATLAASSDTLVPGLKLFAGYSFAGVYMGMTTGDTTVNGKKDVSETYFLHSADLRAVYDIDEQLSVGFNGNLSMVSLSEYAVETAKAADADAKDYIGFNVGLSASYALSDTLAIDFNTGFRCLDLNNEVGTDRKDSAKTTEGDWLSVSSIGVEPSLVFTFNKNAALSLGVNVLIQNLSSKDASVVMPRTNHMAAYGAYYPFTTTVTLPLFMMIRI